ncbi:hypothetical protein ABMA27_008304 [Loxostege sticticalis]|uniref:C3H1-type domain-containing protein n=1 Tax=Loxostege sticticalis TaxID=481309 RepID=A0ABR3HAT6_LOXSC
MPPKKNVENKTPAANKKPQEKKLAKPKVKQLKPKLKTPTVIKMKIPAETLKNNCKTMSPKVNNTGSWKLTKKQLTLEKKLELANEVAAAQLGIKQQTVVETEPTVVVPLKARRGRKKNIQDPVEPIANAEPSASTSASHATDSEDAFDVTPKNRKYACKNPTKAAVKKPEAVKVTKGKKALSSILQTKTVRQTKLTDAKAGITRTRGRRPKNISPLEAPITRCKTKETKKPGTGKTDLNETPTTEVQQSPSILEQVEVNTLKKENTSGTTATEESLRSDPNVEPCSIDSRKTSLTSECLSWTKDISSSSTTTCVTVCSTDIVRIDKKMPIIKLTPTTCHLNQDLNNTGAEISSSSSDSDSSESEHCPDRREEREFTPDVDSRSLGLSTSSVTPVKSPQPATPTSIDNCHDSLNEENSKITYFIDKLTSKLKHFDLEIINWIGYENEEIDSSTKKFHDNILKLLKEESEVITHCRHLKKILSDDVDGEDANEKCTESVAKEDDTKNVMDSNCVNNTVNDRSPMRTSDRSEDDENNFTSDRVRYIPFDQSCDDDDALSLFAESITGMESSRRNSSAASMCTTGDFEEPYVPHALDSEKWEPATKISYPSPCLAAKKHNEVKAKPVCEKQNADSTSIYKESEEYKDYPPPFEKNMPSLNVPMVTPNKKRPCLMAYVFKPLSGVKSGVFRGICFFNILSSCKNGNCRFPHIIPTHDEITAKLVKLSEEMFIQEYMLMRNWPVLRRKYGICFVHECLRRDLTRIAVEMALDFFTKANENNREDTILKVVVIELVLLHLNNVDLELCEDILIYRHQGELLCEIFMRVIANTQNFSRFKPVFINLTKLILSQERTFPLDVATQILERISILPSEPPLLEALLEIVKSTDRAILSNSMLSHFANQLSVASKELHDELLKLKKEASVNRPVLQNLYESSPKAVPEIEPVNANPLVSGREKRYTSPDTTNLDTMNKTTDEPVITRTIDFSRAQLFGCTIQRSFTNSNSPSNDSNEELRPNSLPKPNFKHWRDRSIFNSIRGRSPGQRHATPRPLVKRHVHQQLNFGPTPFVCILTF